MLGNNQPKSSLEVYQTHKIYISFCYNKNKNFLNKSKSIYIKCSVYTADTCLFSKYFF